jgi:hypothetical protein
MSHAALPEGGELDVFARIVSTEGNRLPQKEEGEK